MIYIEEIAVVKKYGYLVLIILFAWVCSPVNASNNKSGTYSIYVVPQFPPEEIHKSWTPILQLLSQATGFEFELNIPATIPDFESVLADGDADFAYMNPYHVLLANQKKGYLPLVRDSQNLLDGILVVRKDSPMNAIADLNGETIAFPAPNAFGATLLIRTLLDKEHIAITPNFVKSHSNVYRSVVLGDTVAGGGLSNTLNRESAELKEQLRVLYTTPKFAPHPIAANPRLSKAVREKFTQSFLALAADPQNQALFAAILMPKPIKANFAKDYQVLKKLELEKFVQQGGN